MADRYKHLFGPVPSRRLGRSLGIDLVPFKTCTFDCIYCQLGRTTDKSVIRREYVPRTEILDELGRFLDRPHGSVDYLTLSGSGEPTLYTGLGDLIASIKSMSGIPLAVLTNGSLLRDREVRRELSDADVVIPTLAADSEAVFRCVHRPDPSLNFADHVHGLVSFSREFTGSVWLELFLLDGVTAHSENVARMNHLIEKIRPAKVQINTASRPPCESFVFPSSERRLLQLSHLIRGDVEVVGGKEQDFSSGDRTAAEEEIASLIERRPVTVEDAAAGLSMPAAEASKILAHLVSTGGATTRHVREKIYFFREREDK